MGKQICTAALIALLSSTNISAATGGCRLGFLEKLPEPEKTIHGIPSSATFLVTPEQRHGPGEFYAKIHGSLVAEVAVAGPDFICEYDVGPSCPQLGQLVSRVKTFAPAIAAGYDQPLGSITLHGTSYRLDIRDGLGLRTSFLSNGSSRDSIRTFVDESRRLLEKCMPGDVAMFIKSRIREVQ